MRDVHDRMPLVLEREQIVPWLYDLKATAQLLKATPPLLERRLLDAQIGLW
jgi:putative SOS response-associated peptidase YedK